MANVKLSACRTFGCTTLTSQRHSAKSLIPEARCPGALSSADVHQRWPGHGFDPTQARLRIRLGHNPNSLTACAISDSTQSIVRIFCSSLAGDRDAGHRRSRFAISQANIRRAQISTVIHPGKPSPRLLIDRRYPLDGEYYQSSSITKCEVLNGVSFHSQFRE